MEVSPNLDTKPRVRRRLIQSTLFPHKSQDNVVSVDEDLEPDVNQEDVDEDYCEKKNKKRKPRAASQSRASRKVAINGNESGVKITDEEDPPVTVKVDFFVKASERRQQRKQQKEQIPINSPEKNEQCCSPSPDVVTNLKSPRKPRRRATSTPKKRNSNATPEKNSTPCKNGALNEDYLNKMLATPSKPIPDLRLEAKLTAEENSRIFAGKQIHPFFASLKTGKKNTESNGTENKWCPERKESCSDFNPVHVFEKTQSETLSVDWRNWTFSETITKNQDPEDSSLHLIQEGSVNCLQFDNFLGVPLSLFPNKGSSIQYPIQLEPECNQPKDIEVVHEVEKPSENNEFVVNTDTLHSERMASKYHDCSYQPENSLWTTKYQPEKAIEICGNYESVKFLNEWLHLWHEKGSRNSKSCIDNDNLIMQDFDLNYDPSDCETEDEETSLKNVLLVTGPVGSGKSAAIYACAKEQGFQVIEVNTSDWRNGALVKQKFGEAVESHWRQCSVPNSQNSDNKGVQRSLDDVIELIPSSDDEDSRNGTRKVVEKENKVGTKTLILFEDVDATLYEDRGFISTIQQLAGTAKRPMILTSNSDDPDLPNNLDRIEISFRIPSSEELLSLAYMVCTAEKAEIEPCLVERFIEYCKGDIRKTITLLQFWCQGQNQIKDSEIWNKYAPLLFDINAGHHVLPQMIPFGYTSKLSEKIDEEITKSTLLVPKDSTFLETIDEEEELEEENKNIDAKKDEMLRRHCSDQDGNDFADRFVTINELLPSCSSSPIAFTKRTLQRKHDALISNDLNEGLNDDLNEEIPVETKRLRRKYNSVLSDSEEDGFDEGLCNKNQEKFEETFYVPEHSDINSMCKSVDVSRVPESSYVPETELNGTMMCSTMFSSGHVLHGTEEDGPTSMGPTGGDFGNLDDSCDVKDQVNVVKDLGLDTGPTSGDFGYLDDSCEVKDQVNVVKDLGLDMGPTSMGPTSGDFGNLDDSCEVKDQVNVVNDLGLDAGPMSGEFCNFDDSCEEDKVKDQVNVVKDLGEEIGDSHVAPMESLSQDYQMMDECSRIDFDKKVGSVNKPVGPMDFVQETWRKLRNCEDELRQYVSVEEKETLEALGVSYGMTNLISEADLLLSDCQLLTCDYLKPSMVSAEKSHSSSWHDDQLQMASTIAQHGFCLYAKTSIAQGWNSGMDLAREMLTSSTSSVSLGKLVNRKNTMVNTSGKKMVQSGVSSKSMLESPLCNTIKSIVPLRSQLSLNGYVFHEYLSSLARISRSESSRLSEAVNKQTQRRKRVARNYLSNGALSLSTEDISLLDQYNCYQKPSSQSKTCQ